MGHLINTILFHLVLVSSTLIHCVNPFATREPEPPLTSQSNWIQPTSPNFTLANLRNAIAEKNSANYMRCLADTSHSLNRFRYLAEPSVANLNPGLFDRWGKQEEFNYLNQMLLFLPKDSTSQLVLTITRENSFQDSVIMVSDYRLVLNHTCETQDCPREMQGQAELRLSRTNEDLWYIHYWRDYATGAKPTWSSLRAYFGK
jgi:hypothetical protein